MKKLIVLLALVAMTFQLQAQDQDMLKNIREVNGLTKSIDADLANTLVKSKKTTTPVGKLYFVSPHEFAAIFDEHYMIVNEQRVKMDIGIFNGTYRLRDGGMMQSLSNIFLYGFQGRLQDLADENGYSLSTKTENGCHVVTGTILKKKLIGIGYKQVIFKYREEDYLPKEIILIDYGGSVDTYTISNAQFDVKVDPKTFDF